MQDMFTNLGGVVCLCPVPLINLPIQFSPLPCIMGMLLLKSLILAFPAPLELYGTVKLQCSYSSCSCNINQHIIYCSPSTITFHLQIFDPSSKKQCTGVTAFSS